MNNQYHQRRQPVAPLPQTKLQIAATSSAGSFKKKQPWTKPSYSNQKQRAYQVESQSEETSFETEWDSDNKIHPLDYYGTETNGEAASEDKYEFARFIVSASSCSHCGKTFKSNNKLHNHLRKGCPSKPYYQEPLLPKPRRQPLVVRSSLDITALENNNNFCQWNYLEAQIQFSPSALESTNICLDTGCGSTLADEAWILSQIPKSEIQHMEVLLQVQGIGSNLHITSKYVFTLIYFLAVDEAGQAILAEIKTEIHIVKDLKARMLIRNNVFVPEGFAIDLKDQKTKIHSCKAQIGLVIRSRGFFIKKRVQATKEMRTRPFSEAWIPVNMSLPDNRDFIFYPTSDVEAVTLYYHVVDASTTKLMIKNDSPCLAQIPNRFKLGTVSEL